jgi:hypothetical protein
LQSQVYCEGAGLVVEAGEEEQVLDELFLLQLLAVEDAAVVDDLSQELDGCLGAVGLDEGHVQVVDEGDQCFVHGRTVGLA